MLSLLIFLFQPGGVGVWGSSLSLTLFASGRLALLTLLCGVKSCGGALFGSKRGKDWREYIYSFVVYIRQT